MARRVLARKLARFVRADLVSAEVARQLAGRLLDRAEALGLIDDQAYAASRVTGLAARGQGRRAIAQRLAEKGVDAQTRAASLAALAETSEDLDLESARIFARRRRLGPYRTAPIKGDPRDQQRRDLATMARAGHGFEVSRQALAIDPLAEEESG